MIIPVGIIMPNLIKMIISSGAESAGFPSPDREEELGLRKAGRSFSAADPATLLLGDFWMAPWIDWIGRARANRNGGNGAGNGGANGGEGGNGPNGGGNGDDSMWGQFTACSPLQSQKKQRRGQDNQRRLSNEYVSGKSLPLCSFSP